MMAFSEAGRTNNVGRLFTAMGHVGLVMIFCKSEILNWLSKGLAAIGKLAISNYIMLTIICNIIFLGLGFSMFGKVSMVFCRVRYLDPTIDHQSDLFKILSFRSAGMALETVDLFA